MSVTNSPPGAVPSGLSTPGAFPVPLPVIVPSRPAPLPVVGLNAGDKGGVGGPTAHSHVPAQDGRMQAAGFTRRQQEDWEEREELEARERDRSELEERLRVLRGANGYPSVCAPGESILGNGWLRKTTGWQDTNGNAIERYHVKRTGAPLRPAWLPVSGEVAAESIAAAKPDRRGGKT